MTVFTDLKMNACAEAASSKVMQDKLPARLPEVYCTLSVWLYEALHELKCTAYVCVPVLWQFLDCFKFTMHPWGRWKLQRFQAVNWADQQLALLSSSTTSSGYSCAIKVSRQGKRSETSSCVFQLMFFVSFQLCVCMCVCLCLYLCVCAHLFDDLWCRYIHVLAPLHLW